jgi:hypothetical protein
VSSRSAATLSVSNICLRVFTWAISRFVPAYQRPLLHPLLIAIALRLDVDNVIVNDPLMLAPLLRKKVYTVETLPTSIQREYSTQ